MDFCVVIVDFCSSDYTKAEAWQKRITKIWKIKFVFFKNPVEFKYKLSLKLQLRISPNFEKQWPSEIDIHISICKKSKDVYKI